MDNQISFDALSTAPANIGISLPGNGEDPVCPVYVDGEKYASYSGTKDELANQFRLLLEEYVGRTYGRR